MAGEWQFVGSSLKDEPFAIKGVDVWGQGWQVSAGEEAHITDPVYGKEYIFRIFTIPDDDQKSNLLQGNLLRVRGDST